MTWRFNDISGAFLLEKSKTTASEMQSIGNGFSIVLKPHRQELLIVSRDGDFGLQLNKNYYLNDWLNQEFKERVSMKRKAELTPSLAQALAMSIRDSRSNPGNT